MTDNDNKRLGIFKKYTAHLQFLRDNGLLATELKYDETYICPVCLRQFNEEALVQTSENPLTLEDAPPKSLGGKANVLTCRECNNIAGQKIDWHLTSRMNELDQYGFVPGVEFYPEFDNDGLIVQGAIKVSEAGDITAKHAKKKNDPGKLTKYVAATGAEDLINIKFRDSKVDIFRLQLALLKVAYLLTFEKFGYSFLLHDVYDRLREQLRTPEVQIYPAESWFHADYYKAFQGVPFITGKGLEGVLPVFVLNTGLTERTFAFILPLKNKSIEELLAQFKAALKAHGGFNAHMNAMTDDDYLFDDAAIRQMLEWINKIDS
ncbi:MAG: hypothetical protein EOO45_01165 [Flavobacterium sp.]|nr:MAG: hypothetical protein EOO45_01165 [Flavobacterium sp.]